MMASDIAECGCAKQQLDYQGFGEQTAINVVPSCIGALARHRLVQVAVSNYIRYGCEKAKSEE